MATSEAVPTPSPKTQPQVIPSREVWMNLNPCQQHRLLEAIVAICQELLATNQPIQLKGAADE